MLCDSSIRRTTDADLLFSTQEEKSKGIDLGAADVEVAIKAEPLATVVRAIRPAKNGLSFLRILGDRIQVSRYFFGS
jgi:hypothetical protein